MDGEGTEMSHADGKHRPATVAEAFAETARVLQQFKIERVWVEGLSNDDGVVGRGEVERVITEQEFVRDYVFHSRPCVIVGALGNWPAMQRWRDDRYLFDLDGQPPIEHCVDDDSVAVNAISCKDSVSKGECQETGGSRHVTVALTPNGRADAVTYVTYRKECNEGGDEDAEVVTAKLFMCAAEVRSTLPDLYKMLRANPPHPPRRPQFVDMLRPLPVIAYAQMQNNCLEEEYQHLQADICRNLDDFGERVFGGPHEAANVWFGTPASVSSMHCDWVENLYAVVRGVKEFVLVSPWEGVFVPKPELPSASYTVQKQESGDDGKESYVFSATPARDGTTVPWMDVELSPAEVNDPSLMREDVRDRLHPLAVYVQPGEVLYIPAMWLHRVGQHADDDDCQAIESMSWQEQPLPLIAAVNYWYDMSFTNPAVVMLNEFGLLL